MKGVINKGIQELVESKFGTETWEAVKQNAGCEEPFYAVSKDYPDELTLALIQSISETCDLPPEEIMIEFGKHWIPNTGKASYPTFYKLAGITSRDFLLNLNRVHEQATKSIRNSQPPKFNFEKLKDGRLLMHYFSRRGFCKMLHGLIVGVGILHNEELTVRETACVHDGAPHCIMEITFP